MSQSPIGIQAAFTELAFLKDYADPAKVEYIKVERVDTVLLQQATRPCQIVWFVSKDGEKLSKLPVGFYHAKKPWWLPKWIFSSQSLRRNFDETIGEALKKLKREDVQRVSYILDITGRTNIWIYKPPTGFTLIQWLDEQTAAECVELRQQLAEKEEAK